MSNKFKVYILCKSFFGQIGGEDKAGMDPVFKKER